MREEGPAPEVLPTKPTVFVNAGTEESRHITSHDFEFVRIILNSPHPMTELIEQLRWPVSGETTGSLKWGWEKGPKYLYELVFSENWSLIFKRTSFPPSFVPSGPKLS